MKLRDWTARRAGGRITITGNELIADGTAERPAKIVGVDTIRPIRGKIVALDKDGHAHELVLR